ncbi:hypothetical protein ACK9YZ_27960 [Rhizobium sp. ZK1]|jgi:GST-like protein|uniref:hypothetical protein n=1 Tax=Rhizobium sp. ZK1 TaxID=3389872 RepID=UPI0039F6D7E8
MIAMPGITLAQSGAVLLYLAEKRPIPAERRRCPPSHHRTADVADGQVRVTLGHARYFLTYNESCAPFAEALFRRDTIRLYERLDTRLQGR